MDAGLLACADTNDSSSISVCDTIRLGVLQCESGNDEISKGLLRELDTVQTSEMVSGR